MGEAQGPLLALATSAVNAAVIAGARHPQPSVVMRSAARHQRWNTLASTKLAQFLRPLSLVTTSHLDLYAGARPRALL